MPAISDYHRVDGIPSSSSYCPASAGLILASNGTRAGENLRFFKKVFRFLGFLGI